MGSPDGFTYCLESRLEVLPGDIHGVGCVLIRRQRGSVHIYIGAPTMNSARRRPVADPEAHSGGRKATRCYAARDLWLPLRSSCFSEPVPHDLSALRRS